MRRVSAILGQVMRVASVRTSRMNLRLDPTDLAMLFIWFPPFLALKKTPLGAALCPLYMKCFSERQASFSKFRSRPLDWLCLG